MIKTLKLLLLLGLLYFSLNGVCQEVDSLFPFKVEIGSFGGIVREQAKADSKKIVELHEGDSIKILNLIKYPYFKVSYKDKIGYCSSYSFKESKNIDEAILRNKLQENKKKFTKDITGEKAPYFKLRNIEGNEVELTDFKGEIVLLEFWRTTCGPCRDVAKSIENNIPYFKDKNVELVFIECNEQNIKKEHVPSSEKYKLRKNTLYGGKSISKMYGVGGVPAFFLIDKEGVVVFSHAGSKTFDSPVKEHFFKIIEQL